MDPAQLTGATVEILKTGLLGALLLLSWGIILYLYKHNQKCTEDQHATEVEVIKALQEVAKAINGYTIATDANSRTMEARTKATEGIEREVGALKHTVEILSQRFEGKLDLLVSRTHIG